MLRRPDPDAVDGRAVLGALLLWDKKQNGAVTGQVISRALTGDLDMKGSPVARFFDTQLYGGLREIQARYGGGAGPLVVPAMPAAEANADAIGTAGDWLMRFMVHPTPSLRLAAAGRRPVRHAADAQFDRAHAGQCRDRS